MEMISEFKQSMLKRFEMSDLGLLTYYLGIEVLQYNGGITMKQESYAKKILEKTGMIECNAIQSPMDAGLKLSKAEEEADVDEKEYRRTIGFLRYLVHTRPDLSYSVGVLRRYMHKPKETHTAALKQVLRYVQETFAFGLNFQRSSNTTLKQDTVALSSCEAEFMAATEAAKQAIWLQDLYAEVMKKSCEKIVIRINNKSAISLTKNPADILTKALGRIKFKEMRDLVGVQDLKHNDFKFKGENVGDKLEE
ncbi:uncharacterized mitochondrial protein AtMg00810-like [Brassica napus]|uniref:uncharacterized mitochondrial protein AtMg00810-like n=1 Tax=Brassica napus TaxID=3708 RepID=UPI0006AA891F|nr:uncharacterized mitochondrial protein AtMg00810-like [Brassica napus]